MGEPEFVTPEAAEQLLYPEVERLSAEGWRVIRWAQYVVRLKRDDRHLDVMVDLTGNISYEEKKAATSSGEIGTLIAGVLMIAFFLVVLVFAITVGLV